MGNVSPTLSPNIKAVLLRVILNSDATDKGRGKLLQVLIWGLTQASVQNFRRGEVQ